MPRSSGAARGRTNPSILLVLIFSVVALIIGVRPAMNRRATPRRRMHPAKTERFNPIDRVLFDSPAIYRGAGVG